MSDECFPHPADLANECSPMYPPKGFTAKKLFVSSAGGQKATGEGQAQSTVSQEAADEEALQRAMDSASLLLRLKIYAISKIREWYAGITSGDPKAEAARDKVKQRAYSLVAPAGVYGVWPPYLGRIQKKPWEYKVTACIPHLNTIEPLMMAIEILRNQTERPYIMVVDTGSSPEACEILEAMRDVDLEIHFIRSHGYRYSSEPVAAALDLSHALCRTEFLYQTHSDVFLRRADFLESMIRLCSEKNPVIGYRMSPRDWISREWEEMIGHTASMFHMPTINRLGISWSMQRMVDESRERPEQKHGWPDTETSFNRLLKKSGIRPVFIGYDENYVRSVDCNLDHSRSYAGSKLYSAEHFAKAEVWMGEAMEEAKDRLLILAKELSLTR